MSFADLNSASGDILSDPDINNARCVWLVTVYGPVEVDGPPSASSAIEQNANVAFDVATGQLIAEVGGIALQ